MKSLLIPCKSSPLIPIPSDFSPKPSKPSLSISKTHQPFPPKTPDFAHLSHLLKVGSLEEAIRVLDSIAQNGSRLRATTFTHLLDCCIEANSVQFGREIHRKMHLVDGINPFVETKLIGMYAKCGCLDEARKMFDEISERNLYSWSAMIGAYSREHWWREVVRLFRMMMQEGMLPDRFLLPKILQACGNCGDYETGRLIHSLVVRRGLGSSRRVNNALLAMYTKCGRFSLARRVFEEMDESPEFAHLSHLLKIGPLGEAIRVLDSIAQNGSRLRAETFIHLLYCCIEENSVQFGREIHGKMHLVDGITPSVETKLIGMYAKCGCLDEARNVFDEMSERNLYSWSAIIGAYSREHWWLEVVGLFRMMMQEGMLPDRFLLPKILQACGNCGDYETGRLIHSLVVRSGLGSSRRVNNALLAMYTKCGRFSLARRFLVEMDESPEFAHLSHLLNIGSLGEAIRVFDSIAQNGSRLRAKTFTHLLDCCIEANSVQFGREIHGKMHLVDGITPSVETKLIGMYAKCGCLDEARKVFDEMSERNLYSWSAIIGAYSREHWWLEVVGLFRMMMQEGMLPDGFLLPKILQACGNCGDYETGRLIHSLVVRRGLGSSRRVNNALLAMYTKCGRFSLARKFFEEMDERDVVSWNSLISGYWHRGQNDEAHRLFDLMCEEGIQPGLVTWNILVACYSQSGDCDAAMKLMKKMGNFGVTPDVFTWTSMISGLANNNRIDDALELFREMLLVGVQPNGVTIASAIAACASVKSLEKGRELHSFAVKVGLPDNVLVGNAIVDMYSKCAELEAAHEIFDQIREKDVCTWNSMIGGYCQHGYCGKAYNLFRKMQQSKMQPNVLTWNVMISGFIQNGDEDEAMDLFHKMGKGGIPKPDTSSWNSVIAAYLHIGQKNKALRVFRHMQSVGYPPNPVTILTILPACANLIAANKVKEIHAYLLRQGLDSQTATLNSLIDTYAKTGNIVYSRSVFDGITSKNVISWNTLIASYVLHGCSDEALDVFDQMKREEYTPNRGTLLGLILAYSRAKLIEKGQHIFHSMTKDYQIIPGIEHYSAMVDLFGRSGRLEDAIKVIECMELEPDTTVWEALLIASRCHGNVALVIHAGEHFLKLNPANSMANHLVAQANSLCGRSVNPLEEKSSYGHKDTKKYYGCSLLEFKNMVYSFFSGDRSPGLNSVYDWLKSIAENIKPSVSNTMLGIHEEEEEEICGVHSEKLALGFALVSTSYRVKRIRIVKNMRICEDCHYTAKYVSSSYGIEILLHDSKCLHYFKNGQCSCGDYW